MAPEIYECKTYKGEPVDIFACGVVLFQLVMGGDPFDPSDQNDKSYERLLNKPGKFWVFKKKTSAEFKDLVRKMLLREVSERISIEDIL
jgi:RAC serine/threonine-protein kinase